MKKVSLAVPVVLLASGCGIPSNIIGAKVKGEGKVVQKSHSLSGYDEIQIAVPADVKVVVGKADSFRISAQESLHENFEIAVKGSRLVVESKESFSTTEPVEITITTPKLNAFRLLGSGDAEISGIQSKDFTAEISGSGDIKVSGQADFARLDIKGSGSILADALKAKDAKAYIAGSGDIEIAVAGELEASISGSGDIRYVGKPKVKSNVRGSGNIGEK